MAPAAVTFPLIFPSRTRALGLVLPVHDEEALLGAALTALEIAVDRVVEEVTCHTVLVFDQCSDRSRDIAASWRRDLHARRRNHRVSEIGINAANVGTARRAGCAVALAEAARWGIPPASIWLATTDADSRVPRHWLSTQLARHDDGAEVWSGTVTVRDWTGRGDSTAAEWHRRYEAESEPAHGASLGVNGQVYLDIGQFEHLASGEDRLFLRAASVYGARCCFDRSAPVITSARREARAPHGFSEALSRIEEQDESGLPTDYRNAVGACALSAILGRFMPEPSVAISANHPDASGDRRPGIRES
jgi:hypothetical protein